MYALMLLPEDLALLPAPRGQLATEFQTALVGERAASRHGETGSDFDDLGRVPKILMVRREATIRKILASGGPWWETPPAERVWAAAWPTAAHLRLLHLGYTPTAGQTARWLSCL